MHGVQSDTITGSGPCITSVTHTAQINALTT